MKTDLFHTTRDYEQFVSIVEEVIQHYPMVEIVIYCLLPNHFHFLLQQSVDGLYISEFMRRLQGSFANYYKVKYKKIRGYPLFEGRYCAKELLTEGYVNQCYTYIRYNPIKHQLVEDVDKRPYLFLKRPVSL